MAVFLINVCKYNGCGITFPSLSDLISHIEDTHIDYDPKVVEQKEQAQPACLPLSYVLRFISEDTRKEASTFLSHPTTTTNSTGTNTGGGHGTGNVELKRKLAIKHHSYSMSSSNRSNTPTGSEMDEDEMVVTESEDSNDSWTTEEFSSEFIMRYGSRHSGGGSNGTPGNEKPFACPVPGCKKRYKNVNGIKYHSKNGHKKDGRVRKGYKCHCGKSYKTAQGLKNHALLTHNTQPESVLTTQQVANAAAAAAAIIPNVNPPTATPHTPILMQRSNSPSQSLGSLSPSSISNMSSSASSCHGGSSLSSSNNNNVGNNMLQQLTVTNVPAQPQHQQNGSSATGNSNNNNLMRSTLGLVSIKTSNNHNNNSNNAKSVSNLMAANATANKILKLATNVANGGTTTTSNHNNSSNNSNKLPLPNLVNLGILTPATSPTKNTQTLTFTTTNNQPQQHQQLQQLQQQKPKTNILLLQQEGTATIQAQPQPPPPTHVLPISPTSSLSGNSSKSSSPTPQTHSQQQKLTAMLVEPMETDEQTPSDVAAASVSNETKEEKLVTVSVAAVEVVGAGVVNTET